MNQKKTGDLAWMDTEDFKSSDRWLFWCKSRHNISYKNVSGQSSDVNEDACTYFGYKLVFLLSTSLQDKTAHFYEFLSNKTLHFKGDTSSVSINGKQKITAFVCC